MSSSHNVSQGYKLNHSACTTRTCCILPSPWIRLVVFNTLVEVGWFGPGWSNLQHSLLHTILSFKHFHLHTLLSLLPAFFHVLPRCHQLLRIHHLNLDYLHKKVIQRTLHSYLIYKCTSDSNISCICLMIQSPIHSREYWCTPTNKKLI